MENFVNEHHALIEILLSVIATVAQVWGPIPNIVVNQNFEFDFLNIAMLTVTILSVIGMVLLYKNNKNKIREQVEKKMLPVDNCYLQDINMLVEEFLQNNKVVLHVSGFSKEININDLKRIAWKVYYPQKRKSEIDSLIEEARAHAYSVKYSKPRDNDEKLTQREILGNWRSFFYDVLRNLHIEDYHSLKIINVGIGNAFESKGLFENVKDFTAVDISQNALYYSKNVLPDAKCICNSAENLKDVSNAVYDLYISFRVFQSSLFDRRIAIHEAYRVLKIGGFIILTIPCLFINDSTGEKLRGLINEETKEIDEEVLNRIVTELKNYLKMLQFSDIYVDESSPYEVFIAGKK